MTCGERVCDNAILSNINTPTCSLSLISCGVGNLTKPHHGSHTNDPFQWIFNDMINTNYYLFRPFGLLCRHPFITPRCCLQSCEAAATCIYSGLTTPEIEPTICPIWGEYVMTIIPPMRSTNEEDRYTKLILVLLVCIWNIKYHFFYVVKCFERIDEILIET